MFVESNNEGYIFSNPQMECAMNYGKICGTKVLIEWAMGDKVNIFPTTTFFHVLILIIYMVIIPYNYDLC